MLLLDGNKSTVQLGVQEMVRGELVSKGLFPPSGFIAYVYILCDAPSIRVFGVVKVKPWFAYPPHVDAISDLA